MFKNTPNTRSSVRRPAMAHTSLLLKVGLGLLLVDSIIEMALLSSMVYWLNHGAGGPYIVNSGTSTFTLNSKPAHMLTDQGHTSNGAAGTAFVLIGLGGILALLFRNSRYGILRFWYQFWLIMTIPSTLLTLAALIYVNVVTNDHSGQRIDVSVVSRLVGGQHYPLDTWTPQNWFAAVLQLKLVDSDTVKNISHHMRIMNGWRWNLIPLFIIELAVCVLAWADWFRSRGLKHRSAGMTI